MSEIKAPERYSDIIDQVCDRDRLYFQEHPDEDSYCRAYVPGEFWPLRLPQQAQVEVHLVGPGVRTRQPFMVLDDKEPA